MATIQQVKTFLFSKFVRFFIKYIINTITVIGTIKNKSNKRESGNRYEIKSFKTIQIIAFTNKNTPNFECFEAIQKLLLLPLYSSRMVIA